VQDAVRRAGGPLPDADVNALNLASWAEDGTRIEVPAKPKSVETAATRVVETPAFEETLAGEDESATASVEPEPSPLSAPRAVASPDALASTRNARSSRAAPAKKAKQAKVAKPTTIAGMPRALTAAGKPSDNASPEYLEKNPLNLNSANVAQLEALPGVGPAMAQKILDYRKQNGGFKSVDELDEVPGVGPKKMEALRPLVDVN
jgi:competence protein ComEA